MNLDKNKTIEEILSFKRPTEQYKKALNFRPQKGWTKHLGIIPSLIFAFSVVIILGVVLSQVEKVLIQERPEAGIDSVSKIEEYLEDKLHWGEVVRVFLGVETVYAAEPEVKVRDSAYSAKFVSQSIPDPVEIEAGSTKSVVIKFKNNGTATWNNLGSRYISAYTMEPRERSSEFKGSSWPNAKQTGKMAGVVASGEVGELTLELKAPEKTGEYVEKFYLAAENYSWVEDGYFFLKINVVPKTETVVEDVVSETAGSSEYSAQRVVLSKKSITAKGGEKIKIIIGFRNKGEADWSQFSLTSESAEFASDQWESGEVILSGEEDVLTGSFLRKTFYLNTLAKKGEYNAVFKLNIDEGSLVEEIEIPVSVTANAPSSYRAPKFEADVVLSENVVVDNIRMTTEPRVRVGISAPLSNFIQFRSYDDDYNVFAGNVKKGVLSRKKFAVIKFTGEEYSFDGGDLDFNTRDFIRLEPATNPHAVYHVPNLISRTASWVKPGVQFNKYRGAIEYRQGEVDDKMYIVNDLLIEDYVRGISENSSRAPLEMVKANLVAARNYVYVAKNKYPFFDVLCNTYDQLYLGFMAEEILPNVQNAAAATRGVMVTYRDKIVTTPYFGNSSGWTKNYSSVWGGSSKSWLVSVRTNYDAGRRMLGHGVGMSQRDAAIRAEEENLNFVELLKYYYTGVKIEKVFN